MHYCTIIKILQCIGYSEIVFISQVCWKLIFLLTYGTLNANTFNSSYIVLYIYIFLLTEVDSYTAVLSDVKMSNTFYLITVLILVLNTINAKVIITSNGPVRGSLVTHENVSYIAYRGIPYAENPTGALRFQVNRNFTYILC